MYKMQEKLAEAHLCWVPASFTLWKTDSRKTMDFTVQGSDASQHLRDADLAGVQRMDRKCPEQKQGSDLWKALL